MVNNEIPENNKRYKIYMDDYTGDVTALALCKHFKQGSKPWQLKQVYRWVLPDGKIIQRRHVDKFESI